MKKFLIALAIICMVNIHVHAITAEEAAKKANITLNLTSTPVSQAAEFISKLSSVKVVCKVPKDKDASISINLADVSAHEALQVVAKLSGLQILYRNDAVHLTLAKP